MAASTNCNILLELSAIHSVPPRCAARYSSRAYSLPPSSGTVLPAIVRPSGLPYTLAQASTPLS
eukprot:3841373-Prymnesium_polylepis.1